MDSSKSILCLIIGIVCGFLSNVASSWTLAHAGRRKLTISTLCGAAVLWGAIGIGGIKQNDNITPVVTAVFGTLTVICCGLGCWPGSYVMYVSLSSFSCLPLPFPSRPSQPHMTTHPLTQLTSHSMSEASALRLRAKSQAIGGITAYIVGIFTQFVLPYLYNPDAGNLKAKTGFVFAGTSLLAALFTWLIVPEMKGRSVMEIDRFFEEGIKARGSGKWKVGSEDAEVRQAAL